MKVPAYASWSHLGYDEAKVFGVFPIADGDTTATQIWNYLESNKKTDDTRSVG